MKDIKQEALPDLPAHEYPCWCKTPAMRTAHKAAWDELHRAAAAALAQRDEQIAALREAIGIVCEGWTLPDGVRKVLETALWASPAAGQAGKGAA